MGRHSEERRGFGKLGGLNVATDRPIVRKSTARIRLPALDGRRLSQPIAPNSFLAVAGAGPPCGLPRRVTMTDPPGRTGNQRDLPDERPVDPYLTAQLPI